MKDQYFRNSYRQPSSWFAKAAVLALLIFVVGGCAREDSTGEFYTPWDIAGGCSSDQGGDARDSALGDRVNVCADVGRYDWIWVTYAAPWCSASRDQAAHVRAFQSGSGSAVAVYTVLTSSHEPFTGASIADARSWASTYRLPSRNVLVEKSTRVIPQHLLIGPDGYTWYRSTGTLSVDEMHDILREFSSGVRIPNVR